MTYTVNFSDSNKSPLYIAPKTVDNSTSLMLIGSDYSRYGELMAENLLFLLENFSDSSAPPDAIEGQIWYNNDSKIMQYFDGANWRPVSGLTVSATQPNSVGEKTGDLWLDSNNGDVYAYWGNSWVFIGGPEKPTRVSRNTFREDNTGTMHATLEVIVDNVIVQVVSSSGEWVPNPAERLPDDTPFNAAFPVIRNGINMNRDASAEFKLHGVATSSEYADLAERYAIDSEKPYGTVVELGGNKEITESTVEASIDVFGVLSTKPAFTMNDYAGNEATHPAVAMVGRVPCRVVGKIVKGQRLVTSNIPGHARAATDEESQDSRKVFARALDTKIDSGTGLIEVIVGSK